MLPGFQGRPCDSLLATGTQPSVGHELGGSTGAAPSLFQVILSWNLEVVCGGARNNLQPWDNKQREDGEDDGRQRCKEPGSLMMSLCLTVSKPYTAVSSLVFHNRKNLFWWSPYGRVFYYLWLCTMLTHTVTDSLTHSLLFSAKLSWVAEREVGGEREGRREERRKERGGGEREGALFKIVKYFHTIYK